MNSRVHQLVSLVQDVPVVHVCLVVPASEVRTMHSKQPCHWNVSRVPREQVGGNTALLPQLTPSGGLNNNIERYVWWEIAGNDVAY